jgi:hypothetical protein
LFRTAEDWLKARGCDRALGPFNLSINEEVGLLVDGFDTKPMVMMGHDPRYTAARVEEQGYAKAKDVYAYVCDPRAALPPVVVRRVKRGLPEGVTLRELDMSRYDEEVKALTDILNDAWSGNWGFVPTTEAETAQLGKSLKDVLDKRLILFSEIDGEPAGFIVLLGQAAVAAEGQAGEVDPHPADGPQAQVRRHPARPGRALPPDERRPRRRPGPGLRQVRVLVDPGGQRADAPDLRSHGCADLQDLPDLREGDLGPWLRSRRWCWPAPAAGSTPWPTMPASARRA